MGVQAARLIRSTATAPASRWCLLAVVVVLPVWVFQAGVSGSIDSRMVLLAQLVLVGVVVAALRPRFAPVVAVALAAWGARELGWETPLLALALSVSLVWLAGRTVGMSQIRLPRRRLAELAQPAAAGADGIADADVRLRVFASTDSPAYRVPLIAAGAGLTASALAVLALSNFYLSWIGVDGHSYVHIAEHGVRMEIDEWPFTTIEKLPGYPLLVRLVQVVVPSWELAAVLTSMGGLVAALCLLQKWMALRGVPARARAFAIAAICSFPFSFFLFGFAYSESTFLALAIACFVFVEFDRPMLAGSMGAMASLVRPSGIALVLALLAVAVERARLDARQLKSSAEVSVRAEQLHNGGVPRASRPWFGAAAVAATGFAGYSTYCWWRWGDPLAFVEGQGAIAVQSDPTLPSTWLLTHVVVALLDDPLAALRNPVFAHIGVVLGVLAMAPAVHRRFGLSYSVYVASTALLVIGTTVWTRSGGRYMIAAFPVAVVIGGWLAERRRVGVPVLVSLGAGWLVLVAGFLTGHSWAN